MLNVSGAQQWWSLVECQWDQPKHHQLVGTAQLIDHERSKPVAWASSISLAKRRRATS
jgi:hypothetical protein